jgi:hypothetical protein
MPSRFVLQVLRHLVNGGVVTSVRGVFGGYRLAKPASGITALDIYEAVDSLADNVDMRLDALAPASRRVLTASLDGIVADARKRNNRRTETPGCGYRMTQGVVGFNPATPLLLTLPSTRTRSERRSLIAMPRSGADGERRYTIGRARCRN